MAKPYTDTLLSLDPSPEDCLYRIRRVSGDVNRVLYVTVTNPAFLPEEEQTYGPSVIAELGRLREWGGNWTTLRVHSHGGVLSCEVDVFPPHALSRDHVFDGYPVCNIFDLQVRRSPKQRVSEVLWAVQACFLKIARFSFELRWVAREVDAYHRLAGSPLAPRFLAYVFEEVPDRIVGFLVESVSGRAAGIGDLEPCREALAKLHRHLIHGDLCRYNILITPEGPRFIDFEDAVLEADNWEALKQAEEQTLAEKLADESGAGRPRDMDET